jgi:simple sugar transport system substrate-binding protein
MLKRSVICRFRAGRIISAGLGGLVAAVALAAPVVASEYKFNYVIHAETGNPFWASVNHGMKDACAKLDVDCQMLFTEKDGDFQTVLSNFQASIAQQVDGVVTTIINDDLLDEPVKQAVDAGIPVIAANVDDSKGKEGNARLAFIGQDLEQAGYDLGAEMAKSFPSGDVHVLINGADLSQGWAKQRSGGIERFMEDWKAANPDRKITWDIIEATADAGIEASRVAAYAQAHPELSAALDVANGYPIAQALKDLGYKPGQVFVGGFDIFPSIVEAFKSGYLQVTVDQQPYLQGYLPVVQLYMMKKYGLGPWDVNTGRSMLTANDADRLAELSQTGIR